MVILVFIIEFFSFLFWFFVDYILWLLGLVFIDMYIYNNVSIFFLFLNIFWV